MATYTIRGTSHNVVYTYKAADGKRKQQWESYSSELEAIQRKAYIDYLQAQNRTSDITHEASEYRRKKAVEKVAQKIAAENAVATPDTPSPESEDNMSKTYREFMERFLPIHARKKNFSPKTYDSYRQNLETHIYPYFGDWVMSSITSSAIDGFIDHLFQKPCRGSKSYGKHTSEIPTLSSGTVKKCYNILTLGFETAKRWNYIAEIPNTKGPSEHYKRRKAWSSEYISIRFKMIPSSISRFTWPLYVHLERARLLLLTFTQSTLTKAVCGSPKFLNVSLTRPSKTSPEKRLLKFFRNSFLTLKATLS